MEKIEEEIKTITRKVSGTSIKEISTESRFKEDLGLDSLDTIELVLEVETTFDIAIPDEDALGFKKIADVQRYVEKICQAKNTEKLLNV